MLLQLRGWRKAFVIHLSLEQARLLAVEMRGIATDHCAQHHLAKSIAESLGARISGVVLKEVGRGFATGTVRLETTTGPREVDVDVAAALAMAMHMGLPIFMDGQHILAEGGIFTMERATEPPASAQVPEPFREVIEGLDLPPYCDSEGE